MRTKIGNNVKPNANQLTKKKKSSHVNGIINTNTDVNSSSSAPYDKINSKIYMSNVCVVKELFECKEVNNSSFYLPFIFVFCFIVQQILFSYDDDDATIAFI